MKKNRQEKILVMGGFELIFTIVALSVMSVSFLLYMFLCFC